MIETICSQSEDFDFMLLQVPQLRKEFSGKVIAPGDPEFDQVRTVFFGHYDRQPAIIIQAANTADVVRGVTLACETGLVLAVRGGGHSLAGHSSIDGGILLDLKSMKGLDIDVQNRTAWAEAGLTAGEYTLAVGEHGLVTGFGDTGSVGIAGITLGGGVGFLSRKYGLTIDDLLAAEMVTADGKVIQTDADTNPDLFWAIRGGGGNFGVVTRFKFRLHELNSIYGGMLVLPASAEVIAAFIAAAESAPEELSTIANIMTAPPMPFLPPETRGKLILLATLVYAGSEEEGQRAVAPFRALATPIADMVRPMRYPEMYPPEGEAMHPKMISNTLFLESVDRDIARTIIEHLEASDAPMRAAQLRVLGGAVARIPADATAFAHRQSRILANLTTFFSSPEEIPMRKDWLTEFTEAIRQEDSGAYVNFMNNFSSERIHDVYPGATYDRLMKVKGRYDPFNLFRMNHNIPPRWGQVAEML